MTVAKYGISLMANSIESEFASAEPVSIPNTRKLLARVHTASSSLKISFKISLISSIMRSAKMNMIGLFCPVALRNRVDKVRFLEIDLGLLFVL